MAIDKIGSILRPFTALKNLAEKPDTLDVPRHYRPAAERYRGFHVNDLDKCIGCGTCAEICDNAAIRMVPVKGKEVGVGKTQYRPAIDYGRCCWCGLCVDVCTTNSLSMTREYTHISPDTDTFFILPDEKGIHEKDFPQGWHADEKINFLDLERVTMQELSAAERGDSFIEIVKGFSKEQAVKEASRCVSCGLCTATCPAHMNIPEYIDAIWKEDATEAGRQMYKTNPLPDVCGRICTHKCETACSLGQRGDPVSIRWLKRYAMDQIPASELNTLVNQSVVKQGGKKIAIVGGGPAGLSAAYYLVLMGYGVTLYEKYPKAGGMMRYGMPEYRLPYESIDKDIDFILSLGVELKTNVTVGKDIPVEKLRDEYDAVIMATGFHGGRSTRVPGTDHPMVFQAVDLLARITNGDEFPVEKDIVVIGGGNVAMDIARSLARMQKKKYGTVSLIVTSLETRDIMPADDEEIVEGEEEGIVFHPGRGPEEIIVENGSITGLKTSRCIRVFNDQKMFAPEFDKNDIEVYAAAQVIEAIGQGPEFDVFAPFAESLEMAGRRVKVDQFFQSSLPWLFIAGDIIKGPDAITGIETGHQAALGVDFWLGKQPDDTLSTIDEVLKIALGFQREQVTQLEAVLAAGSLAPAVEAETSKLLASEKADLAAVEALLAGRNTRIHLRQEMPRAVRRRDFKYLEAQKPIPAESASATIKAITEHASAGFRLYTDILFLTKSKELEFSLDGLRDHQKATAERFASLKD
ncbi:MAG: FAD-dependent oxidoreductase [Spirochaetales bacterium]|nr:FAD-dependent oxidoreductase [Spirochaetales bacterium]